MIRTVSLTRAASVFALISLLAAGCGTSTGTHDAVKRAGGVAPTADSTNPASASVASNPVDVPPKDATPPPSGSTHDTAPIQSPAVTPTPANVGPNPGDVLREAGITPPAGGFVVHSDVGSGIRAAIGEVNAQAAVENGDSREQLLVNTYPSDTLRDNSGMPTFSDNDGYRWYIKADRVFVWVTGAWNSETGTASFPLAPSVIAKRIGGQLLAQG
jgi:hypothetical protein